MGTRAKASLVGLVCVVVALLAAAQAPASTVSLTLTGTGAGTVSSDVGSPALNCSLENGSQSGTCSSAGFSNGQKVTLTAAPKAGSVFFGWTVGDGGCSGNATPLDPRSPCEITASSIGGTTSLTAKFIPAPEPPLVAAGPSFSPNSLLLDLPGTVNPRGFPVGECDFEYDTEPYEPGENPHGTALPCSPAVLGEGEAPVFVGALAELEQLVPGATYHYRLRAANIGGVGESTDLTFTTPAAPPDSCPNKAIRATQPLGAILLPECMALEQASPVEKDNQPATSPAVSDSGERVRFNSSAALAGSPAVLYLGGEPYLASRTATGWQTVPTRTPAEMTRGWFAGARSFSPDLSSWLHLAATQPQGELGVGQIFAAGIGGLFEPLSPLLKPLSGGVPATIGDAALQGASADHSHLYFNPAGSVAYRAGDPTPAGTASIPNGYVAHLDSSGDPDVELLARDEVGPDAGKLWGGTCGARVAAGRGAVSADGLRSYLTTRPTQPNSGNCSTANRLRILSRTETASGTQIDELIQSECNRPALPAPPGPCSTADGNDTYLGASLNQNRVYFATTRQLANTDTDATSDIYLYDAGKAAGSRLTQISAGSSGADVSSLLALSGDGSHAYFTSNAVLTTAKGPGNKGAEAGKPNLYLYEYPSGQISFVATLLSANGEGAYPVPLIGANPLIGGDGHILLFNAKASLVPDDADAGKRDVYRYDSAAVSPTLVCVSCRPGGPDAEPFDIDGRSGPSGLGTDFAETGRWVSEDGQTVVLKTAESLVPGDIDGVLDSYLWHEGQPYRLPGTADPEGTVNPSRGLQDSPTLSHDGSVIAYQSPVKLLPFDRDTTKDVYVGRVLGGFPPPSQPNVCQDEGCQQPFATQPSAPGAGSEAPGAGNPAHPKEQANRKSCPRGTRKAKSKGKARCVKSNRKHRRHRRAAR